MKICAKLSADRFAFYREMLYNYIIGEFAVLIGSSAGYAKKQGKENVYMIYSLSVVRESRLFQLLMFLTAFIGTFLLIKKFMRILPKDQGREFAVNGKLSEGKPRGAGIIMMSAYVLFTAVFVPYDIETLINTILIYAAMLTGFLDDAAEKPWGELKKGLLDLVITVGVTANFMYHHNTVITMAGREFHMPAPVFAVLSMILVWASINVTNCCDGIDGLCGMMSSSTIVLFIIHGLSTVMRFQAEVMLMVLLAYLWFNCSPSRILMGDAGSRAIGVFLAILSLQSGDPFLFIFFAIMIIIDGGLGLLKLSVRRFLRVKNFMDKVRTPIHDHWRKNLGVGDNQVVIRFTIIQTVIGLAAMYFI